MPERELTTLVERGHYFEGSRWHDGRWWVSDFYRHAVFAVGEDGREEEVLRVEGQPSGLGWVPDGSLLPGRCAAPPSAPPGAGGRVTAGCLRDPTLVRRAPDGAPGVHADVSEHCGGRPRELVGIGDG